MSEPIALCVSDIHLSHTPPVARSVESNWYGVMRRVLKQVKGLSYELDVPVICAGDIFDRWNSLPELINFALQELPEMYAVPGQHDLPNHSYEQIKRSAYWTLVEAGKVFDLKAGTCRAIRGAQLLSFPFGFLVTTLRDGKHTDEIYMAVVHGYCWVEGKQHFGAGMSGHVSGWNTEGYDLAIFGDNHCGFQHGKIFNCGTLMRRKIDEINYRPQVGIVMSDGMVEPRYLDTSEDVFIEVPEHGSQKVELIRAEKFLAELRTLDPDSLDFKDAVRFYLASHSASKEVAEIVLSAIGE